jgi:hypothetical protein
MEPGGESAELGKKAKKPSFKKRWPKRERDEEHDGDDEAREGKKEICYVASSWAQPSHPGGCRGPAVRKGRGASPIQPRANKAELFFQNHTRLGRVNKTCLFLLTTSCDDTAPK